MYNFIEQDSVITVIILATIIMKLNFHAISSLIIMHIKSTIIDFIIDSIICKEQISRKK